MISGHLAVIRSSYEENLYIEIMKISNVERAWLGVHDIFENNKFVTVLDEQLEQVNYAHWATINHFQQPDDGGSRKNQHCVTLWNGTGMDDNTCRSRFPYFCQFSTTVLIEPEFACKCYNAE